MHYEREPFISYNAVLSVWSFFIIVFLRILILGSQAGIVALVLDLENLGSNDDLGLATITQHQLLLHRAVVTMKGGEALLCISP